MAKSKIAATKRNELRERIREINAFIAERNLWEWDLDSLENFVLTARGGFDLCYYHEIAVRFHEVVHIDCATTWTWPDNGHVNLSLEDDLEEMRRLCVDADEEDHLFLIHTAEPRPYRIIARDLQWSPELVKNYPDAP